MNFFLKKSFWLPPIILAILALSGIFALKANQETNQVSPQLSPTPPETPENTVWKTYINKELGFEIKHPSHFFVKTESRNQKPVAILSDKPNFDEDEFSLVIILESSNETKLTASSDPRILEALKAVGFSDIKQKFANFPIGNFLGDPPWGYYQIAIPQMFLFKNGVLITIRIHRADQLKESEGGTNGQKALVAKQILSTFKFLDNESVEEKFCGGIAGLPCPEGYECALDGNYPDAGEKCVETDSENEGGCVIGGCNGEICAEEETTSVCIYKPEFVCYKGVKCERQADGKCGWTKTDELASCLESKVTL